MRPLNPLVFAGWNTPDAFEALNRAEGEDRPIVLLNPATAALAPVARWIKTLGPTLTDGLEPGFHALLLSSGTTSDTPRLVALDRAAMDWNADTVARELHLSPGGDLEVVVQVPVVHAFGLVLGWHLGRRLGARITPLERFSAEGILDVLTRRPDASPLLLPWVPAMIRMLSGSLGTGARELQPFHGIRGTSIVGGDRVRRGDLEVLSALFPSMSHTIGYGLTEAGPALTHSRPLAKVPVDGFVGTPLPGVRLEAGPEPEATGWRFTSPGQAVAIRELDDPAWRAVRGTLLSTGDLLAPVAACPDASLQVLGRVAGGFKKGGTLVLPSLVEGALEDALAKQLGGTAAEMPGSTAREVSALGAFCAFRLVAGPEASTPLVLQVEGTPDPAFEARLHTAIQALPRFFRPDRIEWIHALPRTPLGKIRRDTSTGPTTAQATASTTGPTTARPHALRGLR
jgi:acyl-CoA synthetase (AMP-forming)/AMP-acid ligase II